MLGGRGEGEMLHYFQNVVPGGVPVKAGWVIPGYTSTMEQVKPAINGN